MEELLTKGVELVDVAIGVGLASPAGRCTREHPGQGAAAIGERCRGRDATLLAQVEVAALKEAAADGKLTAEDAEQLKAHGERWTWTPT